MQAIGITTSFMPYFPATFLRCGGQRGEVCGRGGSTQGRTVLVDPQLGPRQAPRGVARRCLGVMSGVGAATAFTPLHRRVFRCHVTVLARLQNQPPPLPPITTATFSSL